MLFDPWEGYRDAGDKTVALLPFACRLASLEAVGKPEDFLGRGQHKAALAVLLFLTPSPVRVMGRGRRSK